jgi:hypothetical protein
MLNINRVLKTFSGLNLTTAGKLYYKFFLENKVSNGIRVDTVIQQIKRRDLTVTQTNMSSTCMYILV